MLQIAVYYYYVTCMPRAHGGLQIMSMRQASLLGFVKHTSSIDCVGTESNAPAGEPTRPCTSDLNCFGTENGTSVESRTGEPSRPSSAATFYEFGPPKWICFLHLCITLFKNEMRYLLPSILVMHCKHCSPRTKGSSLPINDTLVTDLATVLT